MNATGAGWPALAAGFGALLAFSIQLALSGIQMAGAHLGRVSLHRMSGEGNGRRRQLGDLARPHTSWWLAMWSGRYASLLGGVALAVTTARLAGWPYPGWTGVGCGAAALTLELIAVYPVAQRYPRGVLRAALPVLRLVRGALYPLLVIPLALTRAREEVGETPVEGEEAPDAEAEAMIEVAEREGILEAEEGRMIRGIVDLDETRVREIMTPRTDIVALKADASVREALSVLRTANHTRLPVYRDSLDDVQGILHVRDLIEAWDQQREDEPVTAFARPAYFVPETMWVADLLRQMRTRTHIALAVDEYGGIAGLVTMEDLLEEIVGDIRDEHDQEEDDIVAQQDGSWLVSGSAHVEELESATGLPLRSEHDFDTVGGLVVARLGRVPREGESLETGGLGIQVIKADPRRVYRVHVRRLGHDDDPVEALQ